MAKVIDGAMARRRREWVPKETSEYKTILDRRRPNRRVLCTICHHLIGPGCYARDHETGAPTDICHRCSEANPQEVDGASRATTELADEECGFWQIKWRRITIDILRRWERGKACIWTNMRHHSKWTRILAERQAAKCSQEAE